MVTPMTIKQNDSDAASCGIDEPDKKNVDQKVCHAMVT